MAKTILYANPDPDIRIYPYRHWLKGWIGGSYDFTVDNNRYLDARTLFYYFATGNTPSMVQAAVGVGSQYLWAAQDSDWDYFDGGQLYKFTIPSNVPTKLFCSLIVYDVDTRSILQRGDVPPGQDSPSLNSYKDLKINSDGSVDLYLGPKVPQGYESNLIRTVPGKGFTLIFRLYAPLEPYFDQSWKLNDLEKIK